MRPPISPEEAQRLQTLRCSYGLDTPPESISNLPHEQRTSLASPEPARAITVEQKSQQFLQSTLDALTSHVAVLDADGTILAVNRAWQHFADLNHETGRTCGVGANYLAVCDQAVGSGEAMAAARGVREVIDGQRAEFSLEYPCHSPDAQHWFLLRVTPFESEGLRYAVVAHENITERKQAERILRASEENYRCMVETALEGVWVLDTDFHTTYVNSQMAMMLGYFEAEMQGLSPLEFVFEADRGWMKAKLRGCQYGFHFRFDGRYRRRDGSELWLLANTRPLWEKGNFVGAFGMYTDITLHKQAEAHQRALLQGLHTVVDIADELLTLTDLDTLLRNAVELPRKKLGLERCSLYLLRPGDDMARGTYGTDLRGKTTDERSHYFDRSRHWIEALKDMDPDLPGAQRWFLDPTHSLVTDDAGRGGLKPHKLGKTGWVAASPILSARGPQGVLFNDTAITGAPVDATLQEIVVVYCSLLGNILARQRAEEALHNANAALARTARRPE